MVGTLKTKLHIKAHQNSSKHTAYTARKKLFHKEKELKAAVAWCKKYNKGGFAALRTGLFPNIKCHKTINCRLSGKVVTGREKIHCSIMLPEEEESLVRHLRNRNRAFQAMNTQEVNDLTQEVNSGSITVSL